MKKSIIALLLAAMLLCSCANAEGQNHPENDSNNMQSMQEDAPKISKSKRLITYLFYKKSVQTL